MSYATIFPKVGFEPDIEREIDHASADCSHEFSHKGIPLKVETPQYALARPALVHLRD